MSDEVKKPEEEQETKLTFGRIGNLLNQGVERAVAGAISLPALVADGYVNIYRFARQEVGGEAFVPSSLYEASKSSVIATGRTIDGTQGKIVGPQNQTEENIVFGAELGASVLAPAGLANMTRSVAATTATATRTAGTLATTRTAAMGADDVALAATSKATHPGFWSANPTRLGMAAFATTTTVAPAALIGGLYLTEYHSGGGVTDAALGLAVSSVKTAMENGALSPENLEQKINSLSYIVAVNGAFNKGLQNQYVKLRMDDPENPSQEDINKGKVAAVTYLALPGQAAFIGARHGVRLAVIDDLYPGNRDQADRHLAEAFVDDIVNGARVTILGDNQLSRDDVKAIFEKAIQNPSEHREISLLFRSNGRIMNGIKQMWPDIVPDNAGLDAPAQEDVSAGQSLVDRASTTLREGVDSVRSTGEEMERRLQEKYGDVLSNPTSLLSNPSAAWDKMKEMGSDVPGMSELMEMGEKYPMMKWGMIAGATLSLFSGKGSPHERLGGMFWGAAMVGIMFDFIGMMAGKPSATVNMVRSAQAAWNGQGTTPPTAQAPAPVAETGPGQQPVNTQQAPAPVRDASPTVVQNRPAPPTPPTPVDPVYGPAITAGVSAGDAFGRSVNQTGPVEVVKAQIIPVNRVSVDQTATSYQVPTDLKAAHNGDLGRGAFNPTVTAPAANDEQYKIAVNAPLFDQRRREVAIAAPAPSMG